MGGEGKESPEANRHCSGNGSPHETGKTSNKNACLAMRKKGRERGKYVFTLGALLVPKMFRRTLSRKIQECMKTTVASHRKRSEHFTGNCLNVIHVCTHGALLVAQVEGEHHAVLAARVEEVLGDEVRQYAAHPTRPSATTHASFKVPGGPIRRFREFGALLRNMVQIWFRYGSTP